MAMNHRSLVHRLKELVAVKSYVEDQAVNTPVGIRKDLEGAFDAALEISSR